MTAPQVRSAFFGFPRNSPPSADVTVALTGLTATFTLGTLVPSTALGLSGQTANFTPGALSPNFALPLAGQSATFTGGTLTPNSGGDLTVALTGLTATFTPGTLSPASAVNVIGQSAAFTPGTLLPAPSLALTGQSASFTQGSLGVELDTALTGQTATFTGGTLTPTGTGDITVALVGLTATFTPGVLIPSGADQVVAFSGGFLYEYELHAKARARRRREEEDALEATQALQDTTDREIAALLHARQIRDEERAQNERLRLLALRYAAQPDAAQLSDRARIAYTRAVVQGNFSALQALERELQRMLEEEDIAALMILLNQ